MLPSIVLTYSPIHTTTTAQCALSKSEGLISLLYEKEWQVVATSTVEEEKANPRKRRGEEERKAG